MKQLLSLLSLVTLLLSSSCSSDDADSAEHEEEHDHDHDAGSRDSFYTLLQYTHTTPVPRSLAKVVADSTAIVVGRLSDVEDGRVIDFREGAPHPLLTAVFEIQVEETLLGDQANPLYAEYLRAPVAEIEALKDALPDETFVFIVRDPAWDEVTYKFENLGEGVPEGATLHAFDYPFGIIAQGSAGLEYPLMSDKQREVFSSTTLDDLRREIAALGNTAAR